MQQIELPSKNFNIAHYIEIDDYTREIMTHMGFEDPFLGSLAKQTADCMVFGWVGGLTVRSEAAVLVTSIPAGRLGLHKADWFYGIVSINEIEQASTPLDAVVDAALYRAYQTTHQPGGIQGAIAGLRELMPLADIQSVSH